MINAQLKVDFARRIHRIGVFQDASKSPDGQGFRLKKHQLNPDAPLSPFYINYRLLQSDHYGKSMAVSLFEQMINELDEVPDRLAAIPEAIVPIVSSLSDQIGVPMVTPRAAKGHGSGSSVDGLWQPGMTALLFDDVVTGAESKLEAAAAMREAGFVFSLVLVLTDRQQGGEAQLSAAGLTLHAAFRLDELLKIFKDEQLMDESMYQKIERYRALEGR